MLWQDILIMIGGFGFSIALWPSVRSVNKPPRSTCLITGGILTSYCIAFFTMGLWLSTISTTLTALMWWVLFFQRRYNA